MKLEQAIQHATTVADLLFQGSRHLCHHSMNSAPLMAMLSIMTAAESKDITAFDPRIREIVLFGSTACGEENPGDIDMMVFDGGFYSNILGFKPIEALSDDETVKHLSIGITKKPKRKSSWDSSWGGQLRDNLYQLLEGWFDCGSNSDQFRDIPIDLQILPITLITDPAKRREVGAKHFDQNFFENAFSTILCFDEYARRFVPTTLRELEEKHQRSNAFELC